MAKADPGKLQGTCSVCLRTIQLRGDTPIRHGFSAVGVRHGQHSGFHTGPCAGTRFPHLGCSTEGTEWALDRDRKLLASTEESIAELTAHPDLTWYPMKYDLRTGRHNLDLSRPIVLRHGEEPPFGIGAPSYASLHRSKMAQLENTRDAAERAIDEYERVLASWSPEKYPVSGAPAPKGETVHMERPVTKASGEVVYGTTCRALGRGRAAFVAKTADPAKVTCKRCRVALGLPPL